VRDVLLGREPADYDVTTDATPDQVMELFPENVAVGAQFGVILVSREELKVEVATFRSDIGYSDGRHPDRVAFSKTAQEDVQRRDFTINGLLMRHDTGEVLDYVGGQADLHAKVIRAIGDPDRRFTEDKLRMLRAVRFAARFGFEIESDTLSAIRRQMEEIHQVSPERLRDELTKMLTEGAARRAFELLDETGLLQQVLPEIAAMKDGKGIHVKCAPGTFRPVANKDNDYLMDRAAQKAGRSFSGVEGFAMQDASLQESMGPIVDRTKENLVSTDNGIIMARQRLLRSINALNDKGEIPPGVDPAHQLVRSASVVLPRDQAFKDAAREALMARPGTAPASV
jgi:tRNA nucleotidyltransferase/poly(A) polymerase